MQIIGLGTDIVEVDRIRKVLASFDTQFPARLCTAAELSDAEKRADKAAFFASRWAAKEAAAKALGCGIGAKCAFNDIEISNDPAGKPVMKFSGMAAKTADALGVSEINLSISHEKHYATATVILCNNDD